MTQPEPLRVNVDLTNPGQFFACCGLLELAGRLWPGAEGWFGDDSFFMSISGSLDDLMAALVGETPDELTELENGLSVKPLVAPLRFNFNGRGIGRLTLDAWMTVKIERSEVAAAANPPWNFWSGQQTTQRIWRALSAALTARLRDIPPKQLSCIFADRVPLSGRFGFDPGAAWNALDVGFSPNEQGIDVASSPAVEMLAAIGIQRFRPEISADRQSFQYAAWNQPLPVPVAAAAASGVLGAFGVMRFLGRVVNRGSYAALARSQPI